MKIKCAAIKRGKRVFTGRRHGDIIKEMVEVHGIKPPVDTRGNIQGFVTEEGKFVNRVQGAKMALESGQIEKLQWPPLLYSEDLY